jgi:hypothetical protein
MTCDDVPDTIKEVNSTGRASGLLELANAADPLRGLPILRGRRDWALMHS